MNAGLEAFHLNYISYQSISPGKHVATLIVSDLAGNIDYSAL